MVRLLKRVWLTISFLHLVVYIVVPESYERATQLKKCATYIVLSLLSRRQLFSCDCMRWRNVCIHSQLPGWVSHICLCCVDFIKNAPNHDGNSKGRRRKKLTERELNICFTFTLPLILHIESVCMSVCSFAGLLACLITLRIQLSAFSIASLSLCTRIYFSIVQNTL